MVSGSTRTLREQVHRLAAEIFGDAYDKKTARMVGRRINKMTREELLKTLDVVDDYEDWGDLAEEYDEVTPGGDAYGNHADNPWYYHP